MFVPEIAAPAKIAKIKAYGAEVDVRGARPTTTRRRFATPMSPRAARWRVHPYETAATIAGQGTVGLEWEEDLARLGLPPLDTVLVAVGGGGLIAGVAAWFAGRVKVVGVEPEGSRALARRARGRTAGRRRGASRSPPIRSARAASATLMLAIARALSRKSRWSPTTAISRRAAALWREIADRREPGGAAAFAALASGAYRPAAG